MVVSAEVLQVQDVCEEQILAGCRLGQEIQTQQSLKSSWLVGSYKNLWYLLIFY